MRMKTIALGLALLPLAACNMGGADGVPKVELAKDGVTDAMIASEPDGEWLTYGRDRDETRFSPLTQVSDQNVGQLGLAWYADFDTARGQEATPLMHDGVLYTTTAWSKVMAYDAATGKLLWSYDPAVPRSTLVRACCDAVNRGVALYGDRVFVGTLDGRLVALDQKTGKVLFDKIVVPDQENYTITGAPRVVKGKVLIGASGAEYKARGYIAAYDWQTGNQVWRFNVVPGDPAKGFGSEGPNAKAMEAAAKTWGKSEWWKMGGGGTVWDSITYDPKTNLVLFGTGNAEPWVPTVNGRDGDSLYTSSVVAVDADTGAYKWHFQETPEDRWDFDSDAQITVADLTIDGKPRHVVMHAPKNGYFYLLDAATGQFIAAKPFATQNWTTGIDGKTGRPVVAEDAKYEITGKPFVSLPGATGAHSWHPMSFSPKTGLVYIPANNVIQGYAADKGWKPNDIGYQVGIDIAQVSLPADPKVRAATMKMTTGSLLAWDPVAGKPAWTVQHVGPWNGGTLATAGNLVFQGTAAGTFDAYSADKGNKLWSFPTQSGVIAAPMTYSVNGQQYVAVMVGWGGSFAVSAGLLSGKSGNIRNISRIMVFKLGGTAKLPPVPEESKLPLDPPPFTGTAEQVARGAAMYGRYCVVCHGDAAVAGGLNPDLRHSLAINSLDVMKGIVLGGERHTRGMVSFKSALGPQDVDDIRQYIIKRANEDKALGDH